MEFCSRKFFIKSNKTAVETKAEMRLRGAASPDFSDCAITGVHLLRERGINATVMSDVKEQNIGDWDAKMKKHDIDSSDDLYQPAVEEMMADLY